MNRVTLPQLAAALARPGTAAEFVLRRCSRQVIVAATGGVREHFQQQRSPEGVAWVKLAHARPDGSSRILQDKGLLAASVRATVTGADVTLTASHPAANVHQYGARIRPRTAKYLAIPVTVEAKRKGSPRRFGGKLFCIRSADSLVLVKAGRGKTAGQVQYVLVKGVTVVARPYLGFSQKTQDTVTSIMADTWAEILAAPFSGGAPVQQV